MKTLFLLPVLCYILLFLILWGFWDATDSNPCMSFWHNTTGTVVGKTATYRCYNGSVVDVRRHK
jgi:hypothetical protein